MKKSLFLLMLFVFAALAAVAQPATKLVPTATMARVVLVLQTFQRSPIANAPLKVVSTKGGPAYEGVTNASGIWECLLPINQKYNLSVGDSVDYNDFTVSNRPGLTMKHSTFFVGTVNGKFYSGDLADLWSNPPTTTVATINLEFRGLEGEALVGEEVKLTADGSQKVYVDSTNQWGQLQMEVPLGESYTLALPYLKKLHHFEFPPKAANYTVRLKYTYAGKVAIERMRAERLAREQEYNAYLALKKEEQYKYRDSLGHKKVFHPTPIQLSAPPFKVKPTPHGFVLDSEKDSPFQSPYYYEGLLVAGACWISNELAAVNAKTGQPVWSVKLAEGGISNIEGKDDVIVCATESCTIYAIAARTGKLLWSKWLATYVLSAPCIADGRIFISYEDPGADEVGGKVANGRTYAMACLDLKTGAIIWQQWIAGEVMSSAVADGANLYFNTFAGVSYVLDKKSGKVIAEEKLYGTSAPTVADGKVYMSQRDALNKVVRERIACFDGNTLGFLKATPFQDAPYLDLRANEKTQFAADASNTSLNSGSMGLPISDMEVSAEVLVGASSVYAVQSFEGSRPLALNGKIYSTQGHVLRCLDATTLAQVWEWRYPTSLTDDGGPQMSPAIAVNGKVVVASMDGNIREFDPLNGSIVKNYSTGEKHRQQPIAAVGNYYAPCTNGKLSVVKTGNPLVDKWHCWGGNPGRNNRSN